MTSHPTTQTTPPDHDWDWTSDGKYSLAELASTHKTDVATLLWKTFGSHSQPALNTYVDSGLWKALVPAKVPRRALTRYPGTWRPGTCSAGAA